MKPTYVNQPITVKNKVASIDASYGPYRTIQEALNSIPYKYRALGRTVAIIGNDEVKEYQWKSGIDDSDLVEKYSEAEPTEPITWDTLEGKPEIIASGETEADARNSIGAGTGNSNLQLGTTSSTAKVGNYQPTWAQVTGKPATFAPSAHTHVWADITDKPTTFAPTIGTTATTAKAGNYVPTWVEVTAKPAVIASGANQAEARTAIGAGTGNSNLAIGTTASTAKAGNYTPSATEVVNALNAMTPEQIGEIQTLLGITPA